MKIIPYTTKLGAQAIFISNLSCWSPACRQYYNTSWISQSGKLNAREQKGLASIGPIFSKYNNRNKKYKLGYLDAIFLKNADESLIWKHTAHLVSTSEYNTLKAVFEILAPRFEKIWINNFKQHTASLNALKYIVRGWPNRELRNTLESFWDARSSKKPISLFYFSSPMANHTNGKTLSPNLIVLERNKISNNIDEISQVRAVILHEIIHARYEQQTFLKKLTSFLNSHNLDISFKLGEHTHRMKSVLREAAVNTLVPNGYIGEKYFGVNIKKRYRRLHKTPLAYPIGERLMIFIAELMNTLTQHYINNNLQIDDNYLRHLFKAVVAFKTGKMNKK